MLRDKVLQGSSGRDSYFFFPGPGAFDLLGSSWSKIFGFLLLLTKECQAEWWLGCLLDWLLPYRRGYCRIRSVNRIKCIYPRYLGGSDCEMK